MANISQETKDKIKELEQKLQMKPDSIVTNLQTLYKVSKRDDLTEEQGLNYLARLKKTVAKKGIETSVTENSKANPKQQPKVNGKDIKETTEVTTQTEKPISKKQKTFETALMEQLTLSAKALPANFNKERFVSNCMNMILDPQKNKIDWSQLDKNEVIKCLIDGAKYDCEYGREFYIIPFWNKKLNRQVATIMFDYKGLLRAMRKFSHTHIKNIITSVVYEGDKFEVSPLTYPPIQHEMKFATTEDRKITFAYCFIEYEDGGYDFEVMSRKQLDEVEHSSKKESSNFWRDWYSEMARKSAIRRISKRVPLDFPSAEVAKVWQDDLERDNAYDPLEQNKEEHKVIDVASEVAGV